MSDDSNAQDILFKEETVKIGEREAHLKLQPTGAVELCYVDHCYDLGNGEENFQKILKALRDAPEETLPPVPPATSS